MKIPSCRWILLLALVGAGTSASIGVARAESPEPSDGASREQEDPGELPERSALVERTSHDGVAWLAHWPRFGVYVLLREHVVEDRDAGPVTTYSWSILDRDLDATLAVSLEEDWEPLPGFTRVGSYLAVAKTLTDPALRGAIDRFAAAARERQNDSLLVAQWLAAEGGRELRRLRYSNCGLEQLESSVRWRAPGAKALAEFPEGDCFWLPDQSAAVTAQDGESEVLRRMRPPAGTAPFRGSEFVATSDLPRPRAVGFSLKGSFAFLEYFSGQGLSGTASLTIVDLVTDRTVTRKSLAFSRGPRDGVSPADAGRVEAFVVREASAAGITGAAPAQEWRDASTVPGGVPPRLEYAGHTFVLELRDETGGGCSVHVSRDGRVEKRVGSIPPDALGRDPRIEAWALSPHEPRAAILFSWASPDLRARRTGVLGAHLATGFTPVTQTGRRDATNPPRTSRACGSETGR